MPKKHTRATLTAEERKEDPPNMTTKHPVYEDLRLSDDTSSEEN
jgi:hypothetical protein